MWCLQRRWYCWFSVWFWIVFCNKKHSPQNLCGKEETFFQSVFEWSKRHTIFEETTTCTLPQAIPYSLFHDKMLHFVEKKYLRHNNLMTGVLWRTLRSKYNKSNFLVLQKRYFGRGNFTFWRIENSYLFFVTFCNLAAQSGKRRE